MKRSQNYGQQGFTIVELIIVVVVIAILAAAVLIRYEGIKQNAYNIQVIAGLSQYREAIESYKIHYGYYPKTSLEIAGDKVAMVCLGSGYKDSKCGKVSGTQVVEDPYFVQELSKVGSGPAIAATSLKVGPESFVGAVYGIDMVLPDVSPTRFARTLQYALNGASADCKLEGAYSYALQTNPNMTACEIILETVPAR